MEVYTFLVYLLVMAGVTYLIRVVPFVLIKDKINNKYVSSFLAYIPYAVLASMTVPAIFYSTSSCITAIAGFAAAVVLSYFERSLITVALSASAVVLITQIILNAI